MSDHLILAGWYWFIGTITFIAIAVAVLRSNDHA